MIHLQFQRNRVLRWCREWERRSLLAASLVFTQPLSSNSTMLGTKTPFYQTPPRANLTCWQACHANPKLKIGKLINTVKFLFLISRKDPEAQLFIIITFASHSPPLLQPSWIVTGQTAVEATTCAHALLNGQSGDGDHHNLDDNDYDHHHDMHAGPKKPKIFRIAAFHARDYSIENVRMVWSRTEEETNKARRWWLYPDHWWLPWVLIIDEVSTMFGLHPTATPPLVNLHLALATLQCLSHHCHHIK